MSTSYQLSATKQSPLSESLSILIGLCVGKLRFSVVVYKADNVQPKTDDA